MLCILREVWSWVHMFVHTHRMVHFRVKRQIMYVLPKNLHKLIDLWFLMCMLIYLGDWQLRWIDRWAKGLTYDEAGVAKF